MNIQTVSWGIELAGCLVVAAIGVFIWRLGKRDIERKKPGARGRKIY